jgi:ABC-type multidrug transport system permease subunit
MENQDFSPEPNENIQVPVLSVKEWLITLVITAIPLVGLIFLFLWAFGDDTNQNKANWAKAALLFYLILFVVNILFFIFFIGSFAALMSNG